MNQRIANKMISRMKTSKGNYRYRMISRLSTSKFGRKFPSKWNSDQDYKKWIEIIKYDAYRLQRMDDLYNIPTKGEFLGIVKMYGSRKTYMMISI